MSPLTPAKKRDTEICWLQPDRRQRRVILGFETKEKNLKETNDPGHGFIVDNGSIYRFLEL